jgi:hypothetical protein
MNLNNSIKLKQFFVKSAFISLFSSCTFLNSATAEVITGTNLSINFESANIVGSGRYINIHRLPVMNTNDGNITHYDASLKFAFHNGELIFERISSAKISPPLNSLNYIPGTYKDTSGSEYTLQEPSYLSGGRLLYTLFKSGFSLQFVSGSPVGNPDIAHREIINSLNDTYSYGLIIDQTCCGVFGDTDKLWLENQLIGVRQNNNNLQITLFTEGSEDFNYQIAGAVLTRVIE